MPRWILHSVDVAGGFLQGLSLRFPPGLTCIIGPRGSGKSTLMEAIRWGIAGLNGASKSRSDMVAANLGEAVVTLRTAVANEDDPQPCYTIRRAYRQPPSLLASDGAAVSSVDLDRGTFLPLDGFSSAEIEGIADESLGQKRRTLLDDLHADDLRTVQLRAAQLRRALEANADQIKDAERRLREQAERIEEIGDPRARLTALPMLTGDDVSTNLVRATRQQQRNRREAELMEQSLHTLGEYAEALAAVPNHYTQRSVPDFAPAESANGDIGGEAEELMAATFAAVEGQVFQVISSLASAREHMEGLAARFAAAHRDQDAERQRLQAANYTANLLIQQRATAEQAVAQLESLEAAQAETQSLLVQLWEQRRQVKGQYLRQRDAVSSLRENTAAALQAKALRSVRVRVMRYADDLAYQQALVDGLHGAGVRNHDDILASLRNLRPEELGQALQENDPEEFALHTSLGIERARKILSAFRQKLDPLGLDVFPLEDQVRIELNVGTAAEPLYKDASELSRGQKCTALLPLLLARRDIPLIIDQPEDNLDNHFIYETVVETIHRMKTQRQMIFITHNANIPVLAEADLVVVLNSDGRRGYIEKSGTLDECRDEIVNLLEGGRDAFERRRQRYARK